MLFSTKYTRIAILFAGFLILLTTTHCKKDEISIPPTETDVRFLGHKGGGNNDNNLKYIENTIPSVLDGLKTMNGVEVDLQMSLDGTIWLYHDGDVGRFSCMMNDNRSIVLMKDVEIEKMQICSGRKQDRLYKLDELISVWKNSVSGFFISMEVKLDYPSDTINSPLIGGEAMYLSKLADSMAGIFSELKFRDQLIIEVYDYKFCTKIHSLIPDIKVCLIKFVSFQKQISDALALGYDGVSCSFDEPTLTLEEVQRARENGLIVQLWTPDTKEDLTTALNLHPNYIQTNNLGAIGLLNLKVNL